MVKLVETKIKAKASGIYIHSKKDWYLTQSTLSFWNRYTHIHFIDETQAEKLDNRVGSCTQFYMFSPKKSIFFPLNICFSKKKKIKMKRSSSPTLAHKRKLKTYNHTKTCTMFLAAIFLIAKTGNHPSLHSGWMDRRIWYAHTMDYYSAL